MNKAQDTFEKEYNELIKINRKLDDSKKNLTDCIRY